MKKLYFILFFNLLGLTFCMAQQWEVIPSGTNGTIDAIHFFNDQEGFCSGGFINILRTNDGGETWTNTGIDGYRDYSFVDDNIGFAANRIAISTKAKTTNGGINWTTLNSPNGNSLWSVSAIDSQNAYFTGTGGIVWRTTNGGQSFSNKSTGGTQTVTDAYFQDPLTGVIAEQSIGIRRTTNGGTTWNTVWDYQGPSLTEMCFVNDNLGFVVGSNNNVLKTIDGGITWNVNSVGNLGAFQGVDFFDENHGVIVGLSGEIHYTNDGGNNWFEQNSNTSNHLKDVRMLSATSAIVIGDDGTILKNNGITLGINNYSKNTIKLYPNPTHDTFRISSQETIDKIVIYSIQGQILKTLNSNDISLSIDISDFKSGSYFVKINANKSSEVIQVIKE
ncbi:MAG: T9SS type A sorting domain-containing protein [Flavobacteriaceae bacterium]|nr:T9SS type A sorting domain-containing protein [Flavobacteriaceae bacterium]